LFWTYRIMLTQDETDQSERTSTPSWQPRLRRYLARRGRQLLRFSIFLVIGLLIAAAVLEIYRGASMIGLPDVGDPFDVAEFRAFRVPADQDAVVLLREAEQKLTRMPSLSNSVRRLGPIWSKAEPELRDWAAANRPLLEKFRQASERPDAILHSNFDRFDRFRYLNLGEFAWLASLEGSRLEEQGDMAGAWNYYKAVFRMKVHVMRRGSTFERYVADQNCNVLRMHIASWAADRRTTSAMLRQALDDIKAGEPTPEGDAFSLKVDYLGLMNELDGEWGVVQHGDEEDQHIKIAGEELPPNLAQTIYAVRRYYWNEPKRSRRVLRMVFANWLAHVEEKDPRHKKPAARAVFSAWERTASIPFYRVGPGVPLAARRLAPEDLAERLVRAPDAKLLLSGWLWTAIRTTERREYRELVVVLAGALYQRDHGNPPTSDQSLVGRYLDQLPDDGSDELDDGKAPTVRDPKSLAPGNSG
jgi:hypothetical protein